MEGRGEGKVPLPFSFLFLPLPPLLLLPFLLGGEGDGDDGLVFVVDGSSVYGPERRREKGKVSVNNGWVR